eukprot:3023880-Alexandrium_andersonii.AAC.1
MLGCRAKLPLARIKTPSNATDCLSRRLSVPESALERLSAVVDARPWASGAPKDTRPPARPFSALCGLFSASA